MSVTFTLLALLGFVVLTAGTAVFVAAEFSLTALERSTVDANARTGGPRDKMVQRAHRTLSFQLSGAQVGISITTLITGYLAEPLIARSAQRAAARALDCPTAGCRGIGAGLSPADRHLGVDGVRRTGAASTWRSPTPWRRRAWSPAPQVLFSMFFTPVIRLTNGTANWILRRLGIEPAEELRSARSPQELVSLVRNSARRGSLDPVTAALVDRSLQFGARTAEELMTPRSKIEALQADDTVADLIATAIETGFSRFPDHRGRLRRNHRHRPRQAGLRGAAGAAGRNPAVHPGAARRRRCRPPSTATR